MYLIVPLTSSSMIVGLFLICCLEVVETRETAQKSGFVGYWKKMSDFHPANENGRKKPVAKRKREADIITKFDPVMVRRKLDPAKINRKYDSAMVRRKSDPAKVNRKYDSTMVRRKSDSAEDNRKYDSTMVRQKSDPAKVNRKYDPTMVRRKRQVEEQEHNENYKWLTGEEEVIWKIVDDNDIDKIFQGKRAAPAVGAPRDTAIPRGSPGVVKQPPPAPPIAYPSPALQTSTPLALPLAPPRAPPAAPPAPPVAPPRASPPGAPSVAPTRASPLPAPQVTPPLPVFTIPGHSNTSTSTSAPAKGIWNEVMTSIPPEVSKIGGIDRTSEFSAAFERLSQYPREQISWDEPPEFLPNCWTQAMLAARFMYSPSCAPAGTYTEKQCFLERCWCVTPEGTPIVRDYGQRFYYRMDALTLNCTAQVAAYTKALRKQMDLQSNATSTSNGTATRTGGSSTYKTRWARYKEFSSWRI